MTIFSKYDSSYLKTNSKTLNHFDQATHRYLYCTGTTRENPEVHPVKSYAPLCIPSFPFTYPREGGEIGANFPQCQSPLDLPANLFPEANKADTKTFSPFIPISPSSVHFFTHTWVAFFLHVFFPLSSNSFQMS